MPAIPSKSTREKVLAIAPKFALASDYVHIKFHGEYPSSSRVFEDDSPDQILEIINPRNPTATDWASNPGWITALTSDHGTGKTIASLSAKEKAFLRSDTLSGSIIINAWVQMPDAMSQSNYLYSYGRIGAGHDGYGFGVTTDFEPIGRYNNVTLSTDSTMAAGERHNIGFIVDIANATAHIWMDGVQVGLPQEITQMTGLPAIDAFAILMSADGSAGTLEWGEGSTVTSNDQLCSDLMIMRFESDISAKFTQIMDSLYRGQRGVIPEILDGL